MTGGERVQRPARRGQWARPADARPGRAAAASENSARPAWARAAAGYGENQAGFRVSAAAAIHWSPDRVPSATYKYRSATARARRKAAPAIPRDIRVQIALQSTED